MSSEIRKRKPLPSDRSSVVKLYLVTLDVCIEIEMPVQLHFGKKERLLLAAYVPSGQWLASFGTHRVDYRIKMEFTSKTSLRITRRELSYSLVKESWSIVDFCHLLYAVNRYCLVKKGKMLVHAACYESKRGNVLLVGHSGAGKTTCLLDLLGNKGIKVFSGNKTIVSVDQNKVVALGGTKVITSRQQEARLSQGLAKECLEYHGRLALVLKNKYYSPYSELLIKKIVVLQLNDGVCEFERVLMPGALHKLYPFFGDVVNREVIIGDSIFDLSAKPSQSKKIIKIIRSAIDSIEVYRVSGSKKFIIECLQKI